MEHQILTPRTDTEDVDAYAFFGHVVSRYSRAQATADGVLVDVSERAKEAGFRWPVALTQAAWADCVEWTEENSRRQVYQDEGGRLWDVLVMAARAAKADRGDGPVRLFKLWRVPRGGRGHLPRYTVLKMMIGGGDDGEPVMTILLPSED